MLDAASKRVGPDLPVGRDARPRAVEGSGSARRWQDDASLALVLGISYEA